MVWEKDFGITESSCVYCRYEEADKYAKIANDRGNPVESCRHFRLMRAAIKIASNKLKLNIIITFYTPVNDI